VGLFFICLALDGLLNLFVILKTFSKVPRKLSPPRSLDHQASQSFSVLLAFWRQLLYQVKLPHVLLMQRTRILKCPRQDLLQLNIEFEFDFLLSVESNLHALELEPHLRTSKLRVLCLH
jgi:hypothetical protein